MGGFQVFLSDGIDGAQIGSDAQAGVAVADVKTMRVGSIVIHRKRGDAETADMKRLLGFDNPDAAGTHISGVTVVEDGLPASCRNINRYVETLGEVGQSFDVVNMVVRDQDALNLPDIFTAFL